MGHRAHRWLLVVMAVASIVVAVDGAAVHAQNTSGAAPRSAEQQLAERYRPVIQTVTQRRECGPGEPYRPTTVESVLGRSGVVLRDATGAVLVDAPTSTDLFARPEGTFLDLPGNPLRPGCTYERWWRSIEAGLPTATYARVASDPDRPGKLVVQYWFWWIFNDWNDKHEGDWEMVQVVFDATTADQALGQAPVKVVFAQHEGAQYRAWDDPALERDGERLVYYPGAGSHAGYDSANRWFGKSASAGFGCDDTRAPNTRLDPEVVLLPASVSDVTDPTDPLAWITYQGHWGQREPSFDNGPLGPPLKESWSNPVRWVETYGRPNAVAVPAISSTAGDAFCSVASTGSLLFVRFLNRPLIGMAALAVLALVLVIALTRTRWRPSAPEPVTQRRPAGSLLVAAGRLQWRHAGTYAGLAAVVLAGGVAAWLVSELALSVTPLGDVASVAGDGGGAGGAWAVPVALVAGALVSLPVTAWTLAAAAAVVDRLAAGEPVTTRAVLSRAVHPAGGFWAAVVLLVLLGLSAVLVVPVLVGLFLLARLPASTPSGVRERLGMRRSFARSWALARGHGWHTFGVGLTAVAAIALIGPLVATVTLVVTSWSFATVNVVMALITMAAVPWAGTVLALLREDLVERSVVGE